VFVFPTPDKRDLLFFVEADARLPKNKVSEWNYGEPFWDTVKYPNHFLVHVSAQTEDNWERRYYAAERADQDNYNFEFSSADMGGRRFAVVNRTYVTLRANFSPTAPAAGAAMSVKPGTKFTGLGYVLMGHTEQRIGDAELDSLFVVEQFTYVLKTTVTKIGVDPLNGETLPTTTTFYYATEVNVGGTGLTAAQLFAAPNNAFWGLQTTGYQASGQQISTDWYVIDVEKVIGGTFSGGKLTVATYDTNRNYYWPPVLAEIEFMDWVRKDGGTDIFPRILFSPEGYNGPCKATVTIEWKSTKFTDVVQADSMQPQRLYYGSPFFTLNVPECLHASIDLKCDILDTTDPEYTQNVGSSRNFPETKMNGASCPVWPASVTGFMEQEQFRGGFLKTTVVIFPPS